MRPDDDIYIIISGSHGHKTTHTWNKYLFLEEKGARAGVQCAGPSAASRSPRTLTALPGSRGSVGGGVRPGCTPHLLRDDAQRPHIRTALGHRGWA